MHRFFEEGVYEIYHKLLLIIFLRGGTIMIYIKKEIYDNFCKFAKQHKQIECGAYLIGNRISKAFKEDDFIVSDVYICEELGTIANFIFTPQSQINVSKYIAIKYADYISNKPYVIGTVHSHGCFKAFVSKTDKKTYINFGNKTLCFLVYSPRFKETIACSKNRNREILHTDIVYYTNELKNKYINEELFTEFCAPDGKNSLQIFKSEYSEDYYSSRLIKNKVMTFFNKPYFTLKTKHDNEIRNPYSHNVFSDKRLLVVGAGTIGSAFLATLKGSGIKNITIIDLDTYSLENISRTCGIGFDVASHHEKKAYALAKKFALDNSDEITINAIAADITSFGYSFVNCFDIVICLADSNTIRGFTALACKIYNKLFLQAGTTVHNGNIIGQISIQPPNSETCYCCVENSNDFEKLIKRSGCSQLDENVSPQVSYTAFNLASRLTDWIVQIINNNVNPNCYIRTYYYGVNNTSGEIRKELIPTRSPCCFAHKLLDSNIFHIKSKRDSKNLYNSLMKNIFHNNGVFSIQIKESQLVYLFAKKEAPILSIDLTPNNNNPNIELLPHDHIYSVYNNSDGNCCFVHIVFSD